jgi:hypothetical protein
VQTHHVGTFSAVVVIRAGVGADSLTQLLCRSGLERAANVARSAAVGSKRSAVLVGMGEVGSTPLRAVAVAATRGQGRPAACYKGVIMTQGCVPQTSLKKLPDKRRTEKTNRVIGDSLCRPL